MAPEDRSHNVTSRQPGVVQCLTLSAVGLTSVRKRRTSFKRRSQKLLVASPDKQGAVAQKAQVSTPRPLLHWSERTANTLTLGICREKQFQTMIGEDQWEVISI